MPREWCTPSDSTRSRVPVTPYELFTKRKPNFRLHRTFGEVTYALDGSQRPSKLGPQALRGQFLGYSQESGSPSALILTPGVPKKTPSLKKPFWTPCPNQNSDFTFPSQLLILGTQSNLRNRRAPIFDILYGPFRVFTYNLVLNITSPNIIKSIKKVLKIFKIFEIRVQPPDAELKVENRTSEKKFPNIIIKKVISRIRARGYS